MTTNQEVNLQILINQHLYGGKSVAQVCKEQNWSPNVGWRLAQTPEFDQAKQQLLARFGEVGSTFMEQVTGELQRLVPLASARVSDMLANSLDEKVVMRIFDSLHDRVGVSRKTKAEVDHTLHLSPETVAELGKIAAQSELIELARSDWSYAHERPQDTRTRLLSQRGRASTEMAAAGNAERVLHGQSSDRVQGPGPGPTRGDEQMDHERKPSEARFSPA